MFIIILIFPTARKKRNFIRKICIFAYFINNFHIFKSFNETFRKLPQISGLCPIVKIYADLRKTDLETCDGPPHPKNPAYIPDNNAKIPLKSSGIRRKTFGGSR